MTRRIIAIDCDGVLLDYHLAYAFAWERAFGVFPAEQDPQAYWPWDRWKIQRLNGKALLRFRAEFNEAFWSTIPAMPGALQACAMLVNAGYDLVCLSAFPPHHKHARANNLRNLGFPISVLFASPVQRTDINPKAKLLNRIQPLAFVDDYAPYLTGMSPQIHCALIESGLHGSPNPDFEFGAVNPSAHVNLRAFARWWLRRTT